MLCVLGGNHVQQISAGKNEHNPSQLPQQGDISSYGSSLPQKPAAAAAAATTTAGMSAGSSSFAPPASSESTPSSTDSKCYRGEGEIEGLRYNSQAQG